MTVLFDEFVHVDALLRQSRAYVAADHEASRLIPAGLTASRHEVVAIIVGFHLATVLAYWCAVAQRSATARWYLTLRLS